MNPPLLDFVVINSTVTLSDVSWFQNFKARASRPITILFGIGHSIADRPRFGAGYFGHDI